MNKVFKTILTGSLTAFILIVGSLFFTDAALAEDPVDPNAGELVVEFNPDPLFNGSNFLPGDSAIGEVKAINGTAEIKRIATEAIDYPKDLLGDVPGNDLSQALIIIIREKNGSDIYGGSSVTGEKTLADFYENGETYLSDISAGGTEEYEFEISFPESKGDEWQGTTTEFDVVVGFQGEDGGVTPPGTDPGSGGGGLPQGLIIKYEDHVQIGEDYVEIEWWTSYDATSQVVYSSEDEYNAGYKFDFSDNQWSSGLPPKYGYAHTTEEVNYPHPSGPNKVTYRKVRIEGLASGITYYYRCVSHASPPTVSRTHSFTTLALADDSEKPIPDPFPQQEGNNNGDGDERDDVGGGIIPETFQRVAQRAADFAGDYLNSFMGEEESGEEEFEEESKKKGQVKSEDDEADKIEQDEQDEEKAGIFSEWWWWILLALILIIFFLWYRKRKKEEEEEEIS